MKIIHLTDTHFVPKGKLLYGHDPQSNLAEAIKDINLHHQDSELAVITGDLTHWGEREAFENLRAELTKLLIPWKLIVGNHDNRDVFLDIFPEQVSDPTGFIQSQIETEVGNFVFLDTTLEGTHSGHYCKHRQLWLQKTLEKSSRPVFLFMHHPPFDIGIRGSDRIGLQQKKEFRAIIWPHRHKIRHLFFGHIHRPLAGSWLAIPTSSIRGMNHQVWFDMNAEQLHGSFEPPAYAVVLINDDSVVVHSHDFMDPSQKFLLSDSPWNDWARAHNHP